MKTRWGGMKPEASCREVMKALQSYLDGAVDEVTTARVTRHLQACQGCGLEAATFRAIKAALARHDRAIPVEAMERLRRFARSLDEGEPPGAARDHEK